MIGRLRRTPQGLEGHPLYPLALRVQRGKLTLEEANARLESLRELREIADSQLVELDGWIGEILPTNRDFAFILASLNYTVARNKGFRRVQVDSALRLSELTYAPQPRAKLLRDALAASRKVGYRRGEKTALARLAQLYAQEGDFEEAIACYKEQVEGAKAGGYTALDVESLLALGDIYREQGLNDLAVEAFERAVRVAGAAGHPQGQIEALARAAELYLLRGATAAALEALERALGIAEAGKEGEIEGELAIMLGDLLRDLRRPAEALRAYRRALALSSEEVAAQIRVLGELVPLCAEAGRWQETADYARQGLLLSSGAAPLLEIDWLLDLAMALLELGRPEEAVDAARDALAIAREVEPGGRPEHDALGRLGMLLSETGDWENAALALDDALKLSRALDDPTATAGWLTHLARCAWYAGDSQSAIIFYNDALELVREIEDRPLEAHILGSLGTLLREGGQPRRGLEYYQEALSLSKVAGDGREAVRYLTLLGRTYSQTHQPDQARRSFEEALALARRIGDTRGQIEAHRRFSTHLNARRDREPALEQIVAAAGLIGGLDDPRLAAVTLRELAAAQEELGRWEESAASYRRLLANAERLDDLAGKLQAHFQLGRLLKFQQPTEARKHLRQALDLAYELNDPALIDRVSELLPTGTDGDSTIPQPALSPPPVAPPAE